jgi:hypothetical protein
MRNRARVLLVFFAAAAMVLGALALTLVAHVITTVRRS